MIRSLVTISCGVALLLLTLAPRTTFSQSPSTKSPQSFQELFDYSLKEKKGLTFFVQGQTIPGVVTKCLAMTLSKSATKRLTESLFVLIELTQ